ncbi:MAG: peptide deformylase [Eubacteriaceae bacterium]|nr:peptide deformylase [Eubacteriaceae bacterium]
MIRPVVRDIFFLSQRSEEASAEDISIGQDLRDTLRAHREHCIGMAANMIGYQKRIIIVDTPAGDMLMFDPVITKRSGPYETEEGCLSLDGVRKTLRYMDIETEFYDERFKRHRMRFSGLTAQAVQHEIDHLDGMII